MEKNQIFNPWLQEILLNFVNLIASIHNQDYKPNAKTLSCAQRPLPNLKISLKNSILKTWLEVDSSLNFHPNSFLQSPWTHSNQNRPSKRKESVTRTFPVQRKFDNRISSFKHFCSILSMASCLFWASETNHCVWLDFCWPYTMMPWVKFRVFRLWF